MKTITALLLIFFSSVTYGQTLEDLITGGSGEAKIDTASQHYINAQKAGVELIAFSTSGCDDSYGNERIPAKMIKHEFENDTLTLVIEFSDACCISFLGDIDYKDNSLNLKYSAYGEPCECRCYYTLEYKIITSHDINSFLFNGFQLKQ